MNELTTAGSVIPGNVISIGSSLGKIVKSHCWRDEQLYSISLVKELDTKRIKKGGALKRQEIDYCLEVGQAILKSKDLSSAQKRDAIIAMTDRMSRIK